MQELRFTTLSLDAHYVENTIAKFYGIGLPSYRSFNRLEVGIHGGYSISGTKGLVEFSADVNDYYNDIFTVHIFLPRVWHD